MTQTRRPALSGNALKGIAILAMTLDHLTWTLWPGYATDWWVLHSKCLSESSRSCK